jgi:hypothetical protein
MINIRTPKTPTVLVATLAAGLLLLPPSAFAQVGSDDADMDGLNDWEEVNVYGTDPGNSDTDGDILYDGPEVYQHGTNPLSRDTDGDGIEDEPESAPGGTDPVNWDTDGDYISDGAEYDHDSDPLDSSDPGADPDGDYDSNECEHYAGTDPFVHDGDPTIEIEWIGSPQTDGLDVHFSWIPPAQYDTFEIRRIKDGQTCYEMRSATISGNTVTLSNELTPDEAYYGNPYFYLARFKNGSTVARWKPCSD